MRFSSYARFNGGFRFSGQLPRGALARQALVESMGPSWADDGYTAAKLAAIAGQLGSAGYATERAYSQRFGARATDQLPTLERQYGPTPAATDTLTERRAAVAIRQRIVGGGRRDNVEAALTELLGADFVALKTHAAGVASPAYGESASNFAPVSRDAGVIRFPYGVSLLGAQTVHYSLVVGSLPVAGEAIVIDPGSSQTEKVTVAAIDGATLTAVFTKSHDVGSVAKIGQCIQWASRKRILMVIVKPAAALDRKTRAKIDDIMRRYVRATTQWSILAETTEGEAGPFITGVSPLGATPVEVV